MPLATWSRPSPAPTLWKLGALLLGLHGVMLACISYVAVQAHHVGDVAPALAHELQHGVRARRLALDLHRHHAEQQDLRGRSTRVQGLGFRGLKRSAPSVSRVRLSGA